MTPTSNHVESTTGRTPPEDLLQDILNLSVDYAYVLRVEGPGRLTLEWGSKNYLELIAPARQDNLLETIRKLVHPDDRGNLAARIEVLRQGRIHENTIRLRRPDGSYIWVEDRVCPYMDGDGNLVRIAGMARDITKRRGVEQELLENQKRYALATEAGHTGVWEVNLDTGEVFMDPQSRRLVGIPESTQALHVTDTRRYVHKEDLKSIIHEVREKVLIPSATFQKEFRVHAADASLRWMFVQGQFHATGDVSNRIFLGTLSDITDRKNTEIKLRDSESKIRRIIEKTSEGVMLTDETGTIIEWNEAQSKISGLSRDKAIGEKLWNIQDVSVSKGKSKIDNKKRIEKHKKELTEALKNGYSELFQDGIEVKIKDKHGKIKSLIQSPFAIESEKGYMLASLTRDITERVLMEDKLRISEEKYRLLVDNMKDIILKFDDNYNYTFYSPSYARIVENKKDIILDRSFIDIVKKEHRKKCCNTVKWVLENNSTSHEELLIKTKTGWRWMSWVFSYMQESNGSDSIIAVGRDISIQKRVEEQLITAKIKAEEANRAKETFLSNTTHEMRTPLTAIIGLAEMLMDNNIDTNTTKLLEQIISEAEGLIVIISDILDHIKLKSNIAKYDPIYVDIEYLLKSLGISFMHHIEKKKLDYVEIIDDKLPKVIYIDPVRFKQVFYNLLWNAIKFTDTGSITLKAELINLKGDMATLAFSIRDTGVGIPKDKLEKVFDSFFQVDGSRTRSHGGTGLGTTIARQLVQLMGGDIGVESTLGVGSTFRFIINVKVIETPDSVYEGVATQSRSDNPPAVDLSQRRLLLVEDYPPNQQILMAHLLQADCRVEVADNGKMAVELCKKKPFDLILMDVLMPEMDGFEATRLIRKGPGKNRNTPILALTATTYLQELDRCLTVGMNDVVPKPIRKQTLLETVDRWFTHPEEESSKTPEIVHVIQPAYEIPKKSETFNLEKVSNDFGPDASRLLNLLAQHVEKQLGDMGSAIAREDLHSLRFDAHSIKSGAGFYGVQDVSDTAGRLEKLCMEGKAREVEETYDELLDKFQTFKRELESVK